MEQLFISHCCLVHIWNNKVFSFTNVHYGGFAGNFCLFFFFFLPLRIFSLAVLAPLMYCSLCGSLLMDKSFINYTLFNTVNVMNRRKKSMHFNLPLLLLWILYICFIHFIQHTFSTFNIRAHSQPCDSERSVRHPGCWHTILPGRTTPGSSLLEETR